MNINDYSAGFLLGLSLIIAIGSQNAFVLKQGLKREHIFFVCLFCAVSASFFFFFALGYGARLLRPLFAKPKAWNILDALVGVLMLYLAWHLYKS